MKRRRTSRGGRGFATERRALYGRARPAVARGGGGRRHRLVRVRHERPRRHLAEQLAQRDAVLGHAPGRDLHQRRGDLVTRRAALVLPARAGACSLARREHSRNERLRLPSSAPSPGPDVARCARCRVPGRAAPGAAHVLPGPMAGRAPPRPGTRAARAGTGPRLPA